MTQLNSKNISGLLFAIILCSCVKKYKSTTAFCDKKKLYIEVFNVNPMGVNAEYLTDSVTFRKYIGDLDEEHEIYNYYCLGDSIHIMKTVRGNRWAEWDTANGTISLISNLDTIQTLTYSISQLKKEGNLK